MARRLTFHGGVRPAAQGAYRQTLKNQTGVKNPSQIKLALTENHILCVNTGDNVGIGEKIADSSDSSAACALYSGISGVVENIQTDENGRACGVVIKSDGSGRHAHELEPFTRRIGDCTPDELIEVAAKAGIYDPLNGAPLASLLSAWRGKVKTLIVSACGDYQYSANNYRLMTEEPKRIAGGCKLLLYILGVREATIIAQEDELGAVNILEDALEGSSLISVKIAKDIYPQAEPRLLAYALTGNEIPSDVKLIDEGCAVFEAETLEALYMAFAAGQTYHSRRVTLIGADNNGVFIIPFGTPVSELAGEHKDDSFVICGNPMKGKHAEADESYTGYADSTVSVIKKPRTGAASHCIHCGRCTDVCPYSLSPLHLAQYAAKSDAAELVRAHISSCTLCGCCEYVCPGKMPLTEMFASAMVLAAEDPVAEDSAGKNSGSHRRRHHASYGSIGERMNEYRRRANSSLDEEERTKQEALADELADALNEQLAAELKEDGNKIDNAEEASESDISVSAENEADGSGSDNGTETSEANENPESRDEVSE